ncbi:MAG: 3D domain-containing protein [Bacteriovorax sp.]
MLKVFITCLLFSMLSSCAFAKHHKDKGHAAFSRYSEDPLAKDTFSFREPSSTDLSDKINLWGTFYYLPQINDGSGEYLLRDMQGQQLGPSLTLHEWCDSALEGSVRVIGNSGDVRTFNFAGVTTDYTVDCKDIFKPDVSKTKFREAKGPYGDGLEPFILAPYRTLATDNAKIPPGTVIYIPEARGAKIVLSNGRVIVHDGYFFAADKGGAIKDNHIDVFIGTHKTAPFFPWIKSSQDQTFDAYIVVDKKIISDLYDLHTL